MDTIYIASDHGGFNLKTFLVKHLKDKGCDVHDLGPSDPASCDYPLKAQAVTDALKKDEKAFGILVCGTGIGMSMAANHVPGMRAPSARPNTTPPTHGHTTTPTSSASANASPARDWPPTW